MLYVYTIIINIKKCFNYFINFQFIGVSFHTLPTTLMHFNWQYLIEINLN